MRRVLLVLGGVVLVLLLLAAGLYASDVGVGADVTKKDQDSSGNYIVATTILGTSVRRDLPLEQWLALRVGNYLVYHLQSGHVEVYEHQGGRLLYKA